MLSTALLVLVALGCSSALKTAIRSHPPSSFTSPATFEHVCIAKLSESQPPKLLFAKPPGTAESSHNPGTDSSGKDSSGMMLPHPDQRMPDFVNLTPRRSDNMRMPREGLIEVEEIAIESVYDLSLGDLLNASNVAEIHFVGGTSYLVRSPCDLGYAENYFNALTEEGPLLDLITSAVPVQEHEHRTLMLTNVCPHALYRDDIRTLLLGRRNGVMKIVSGGIFCAKRLVTAEIVGGQRIRTRGEYSLRKYVERLKSSAVKMRGEGHSCKQRQPNSGASDASRLSDQSTSTRFDESFGACFNPVSEPQAQLQLHQAFDGLRVVLIQRTRSRRIRNMGALEKHMKRAFREVSFSKSIASTMHLHGAQEIRRAVVRVIFFEEMSLVDEINLMEQVDVLIGVTGSGLSNLAFMRPGSIVVELTSPHHVTDYFPQLIARVHGRIARGVITYRRLVFDPINASRDDPQMPPIGADDLDAHVNTTAVTDTVLKELTGRLAGMGV